MAGPGLWRRSELGRFLVITSVAAIVLAVPVLTANAGMSIAGPSLGASSPGASAPSLPASARVVPGLSPGTNHSLTVTASNATALQGDSVEFTASGPGGVDFDSYDWQFGDGTSSVSTGASVNHTYSDAGSYLIYVQATTAAGAVYDNLASLLPFSVQASYAADLSGDLALLDGAIQENSTSNQSARADIAPGGVVLVANWIDIGPSNPSWQESLPTYAVGADVTAYATLSPPVLTLTGIDAEAISFATDTPFGSYQLTFSETTASDLGSGAVATANFTFTIFVATGAGVTASSIPTSPHPGTLDVYLTGYAGELDADPATEYLAPGLTTDYNVYQTLVAFNGSQAGPDPSDYVPDLATCVPGPECEQMYGTSLIAPNGDWTFVINPNATFYNVTTGAHYPVTPDDVAFSFARACLLTNYPYYVAHGSWTLCQALLPSSTANQGWDGALHWPLNNTPANILAGMTVNDSSYCTPEMMNGLTGAGCLTLHTAASGQAWPELLEFVAAPWGGSVTSCRWVTAEGYGLPGWGSGASCAPPASPPGPEAWDTQEVVQGISDAEGVGINASSPLTYHAVGSGPYALSSVSADGSEFQLTANPYWGGTTCVGGIREGCLPSAPEAGVPAYIPKVAVFLNGSSSNQTEAVLNGTADIAGLGTAFNPNFVAGEFRSGSVQFLDLPTITDTLAGFNMDVNLSVAQNWTATPLSFPSSLMTDLNFRQFLVHSFPTDALASACTTDGIETCFQSGGAIPTYMAPYDPNNISWFFGTPDSNPSDVGGAAWWWGQTESDGLDGASCTTASPCTFPLVYYPAGSNLTTVFEEWATEVRSISQGAVAPVVVTTTNFTRWATQAFGPQGGAAAYEGVWIPDYFDPSDYMLAFYLNSSLYGNGDSTWAIAGNSTFTGTCAGPAVDPVVTLSCQGSAYEELQDLLTEAGGCALPSCAGAQRALLYNMAENIANGLGLFANTGQLSTVLTLAPWIDETTIARNPFMTSNEALPFYYIAYRGAVPLGYPLVVSPVSDPVARGGGSTAGSRPVFPDLSTASPGVTLEAGQMIAFSMTAAGGTGVYQFTWLGLPPGCSSQNAPFLVCSPNGSVNTTVSVEVTDSDGDTALATGLGLVVVPHVSVQQFTVSPASVTAGQTVTINVTVAGGLGPFTYSYLGLPAGCLSSNASRLTCEPSAPGTYSIVVEIADATGLTALGSAGLSVSSTGPAPTPTPTPTTPTAATWSWPEILVGLVGAGLAGFLIGAGVVRLMNRRSDGRSKGKPPPDSGPPAPPA